VIAIRVFDADNRLTQDTVVQSPVGGTASTTVTSYDYRLKDASGYYGGADQGVVTHSYQYDPSKAAGAGVHTDTSFVWWDEAKQSKAKPDHPARHGSGQPECGVLEAGLVGFYL
jgi:hypothetical protein